MISGDKQHVSLTCNVKFIDDLFDFPSKPRQNRDIKDSMRQHETLSRGDLVLKSSGKRLLCTAVPFTISHCIIVEEYSINIPTNATSQYMYTLYGIYRSILRIQITKTFSIQTSRKIYAIKTYRHQSTL